MFLGEPQPTQYDLRFSIAGVPVRIHPMFWLMSLLLGAGGNPEPRSVFIWVVVVLVSILVHELGHVAAYAYYGMRAHVVLYGMGGLAIADSTGWGWSNRARPRNDWVSNVVISAAGPAAGFAFAGLLCLALVAAGNPPQFARDAFIPFFPRWMPFESDPLNEALFYLFFVNILWGLVNLLPIFPLDGGQIARAVLTRFNPHDGLQQSLLLSMIVAIGAAVLMYVKLGMIFAAIFFGFMAYSSFQAWQQFTGGGRRW